MNDGADLTETFGNEQKQTTMNVFRVISELYSFQRVQQHMGMLQYNRAPIIHYTCSITEEERLGEK